MVLDECTEFPATFQRAKKSMELTLRWANRCKKSFNRRRGFFSVWNSSRRNV